MSTKWKIFRAANFVKIGLIVATISLAAFNKGFSVNRPEDVLGFFILVVVSAIFTANCINNILLLNVLKKTESLSLSRKVFSWCLSIFSCLFSAGLVFAVIISYPYLSTANGIRKPLSNAMIISLLWILSIGLIGLFIFVMQLILFNKLKKNAGNEFAGDLASIGEAND